MRPMLAFCDATFFSMQVLGQRWLMGVGFIIVMVATLAAYGFGADHEQQPAEGRTTQVSRAIGTLKGVQADSITLSPDSGGEMSVMLVASTKIMRVAPGQTDLKNATPLPVGELQPGDRVLVRGQLSADGHSMTAFAVIVMKHGDVSAKQEREREDWQRRGVGGLVSAVDRSTGTITITSGGFGASRKILVHASSTTMARRYAPDSVKFDDAKPAPLDQIKPGDQLRARGTRSFDGNELTAEEIVSGTFRNIAGTISAIDVANNSLTVQDAIGKGAVVVKLSPDSQIKKLPAEMAQRMAMRLKASSGADGDEAGRAQGSRGVAAGVASGANPPLSPRAGGMAGERGNGAPDFQRFLSRMPTSTLSDLQKGDAVMIVSTLEEGSGPVMAITLLAGVEPILTAVPSRTASMMLSPWTLSGPSGEAEAVPQ
jgi:Domain of unknown function (DUF5666)